MILARIRIDLGPVNRPPISCAKRNLSETVRAKKQTFVLKCIQDREHRHFLTRLKRFEMRWALKLVRWEHPNGHHGSPTGMVQNRFQNKRCLGTTLCSDLGSVGGPGKSPKDPHGPVGQVLTSGKNPNRSGHASTVWVAVHSIAPPTPPEPSVAIHVCRRHLVMKAILSTDML